jgi:hypothetical protein
MLAAIHSLLRGERECPRPRIANLGFDRERHASPLPTQMSTTAIPPAFPKSKAARVAPALRPRCDDQFLQHLRLNIRQPLDREAAATSLVPPELVENWLKTIQITG